MKQMKLRLVLAASAVALASACAAGSVQLGDAGGKGCKTVYVFRPGIGGGAGGIQQVNSCAGLPRERLAAPTLVAQLASPEQIVPEQIVPERIVPERIVDGAKPPPAASGAASPAAEATRPYFGSPQYAGASEMIEAADMGAFMSRVRADYAAGKNEGAWGFMIIDALAAGAPAQAQDVLDVMATKKQPDALNANQLRPWVMAAAGRADRAMKDMEALRRQTSGPIHVGHRALLAEGMGDTDGAIRIYQAAPQKFDPPKPEEAATPGYLSRAVTFGNERRLALRHAELLRAVGRDADAVTLLQRLANAAPDDGYIKNRLEKALKKEDRRSVRTLNQALAVAISDESDLVEERQAIMGMMIARGSQPPFNHLTSSIRQSALLLDPDDGDIRLQEVRELYRRGYFEAALRLSQIGSPPPALGAELSSIAALAALELGAPETTEKLVERALAYNAGPEAKLSAAGALTTAGRTDRAIQLIDQALKTLSPEQKPFALMAKGQAKFQAGDVAGAVAEGRAARALEDDEDTRQFLASMLVKSPVPADRPEGLKIMRQMLMDAPGNTSLMNNFGYSLIDGYQSDAELEEGFKLLKEASRLAKDEPNLLDSIGWAYYQYGDFQAAERFLILALEHYAPFAHWELADHMGDIQWRLGQPDKAREYWTKSANARPPAHEKGAIQAKLANGLAKPAPVERETPEVPLTKGRGRSSDI